MSRFALLILLTFAATPALAQCVDGVCLMPSPHSGATSGRLTPLVPVPDTSLARRLAASTVRIINSEGGSQSIGSGAIVDKNGDAALVLTCGHLFREGIGRVIVIAPSGRTYAARVLDVDSAWDMAVLIIGAPDAPAIPLAASPPAGSEDLAYAGYGPQGRFASGAGRLVGYVRMQGTATADTLQLTGAARQGDSGGPIINACGQLVGLIVGTNGRIVIGPSCRPIKRFLDRFVGPADPARGKAGGRVPAAGNDANARLAPPTERDDAEPHGAARPRQEEAFAGVRDGSQQPAAPARSRPHAMEHVDDAPAPTPAGRRGTGQEPEPGARGPTDVLALVLPLLLAALGISVPPTTVLIAFRVFRCARRAHLRRARRRRRPTNSHPHEKGGANHSPPPAGDAAGCNGRHVVLERNLNDDYAGQLASVFANSGRSLLQDATLGREFSREIDRAASSSDAKLAEWATDLRDRVMRRFHRIHGWTPSPAEPLE